MDSDKENCGEKSKKRPRLSLSLKNLSTYCKQDDETERWQKQRDGDQCPSDLLERPSAEKLNYWLSCFVVEYRRVDGQPYPSSTLYQLLAGLLRFSRSKSKDCPNFSGQERSKISRLKRCL